MRQTEKPELNYDEPELINVGTGEEVSILELARIVAEAVGFYGKIGFDKTKPDGTPRKLMDCTRLHSLGFHHQTSLKEGIVPNLQGFFKKSPRLQHCVATLFL